MPQQLTGKKPEKPAPPPPKQHRWDGGNTNAPGWLNGGVNERTCLVCGCTERPLYNRPDRKGMGYHYVDAVGKEINSFIPLSCPVFVGDAESAVGESKERLRGVTGRVGCLEERTESVEDRLDRLEAENAGMKAQLAQYPVDVTDMVDWMAEQIRVKVQEQVMAALAAAMPNLALPPPTANPLTIVVEAREVVPVPAQERKV